MRRIWVIASASGNGKTARPRLGGDAGRTYERKLGDLVLRAADVVVWLDLPIRVWLPRLLRRTTRRIRRRERLWNDNRESFADAFWGRESLVWWALRSHFRRRREWTRQLAAYPVVRLTTPADVQAFLSRVSGEQRPALRRAGGGE